MSRKKGIFEKARFAGMVFAGGVDAPGGAKGHPALEKAYQMGQDTEAKLNESR